MKISVFGAVQGVGFRPFVYRLARSLSLKGWVKNSSQGLLIEAEGTEENLNQLVSRLRSEKPKNALIQNIETVRLEAVGLADFEIRESSASGLKQAILLPDIATCPDCLKEIFDPAARRYQYPFTNCTHCGPRFTIVESLPYDRSNTTMKDFEMCASCRTEYEDPDDRRFHAQPIACPQCGPHLELWEPSGKKISEKDDALKTAAEALKKGQVVAVKGVGGFHLMANASDDSAVRKLRTRKEREEKPLAVMFPDLDGIQAVCEVSGLEEQLLASPEAPIVLLKKKPGASSVAESVAPSNPFLGLMLPSTPLHHLLLKEFGGPLVATSGNLSDEPICTDENDALRRLGGIADLFLVHDRPIARHTDDSIVRVMMERPMMLRRARGFAPLPLYLKNEMPSILAMGAHLKNTVSFSLKDQIFTSQHIGDLDTPESRAVLTKTISDFEELYGLRFDACASDLHPDYFSTQAASKMNLENISVQHHYAHILACMAENEIEGTVLGIAWDGTGLGTDGTIWGGEFLKVTEEGFERAGHLRTFRLPGSDKAVREPRRAALGLLYKMFGPRAFDMQGSAVLETFSPAELSVLKTMLENGIHSPVTSSAGRLFDAAASVLGVRQINRFEGQAAMALEFLADGARTEEFYPVSIMRTKDGFVADWEPLFQALLKDVENGASKDLAAAKFHNALAEGAALAAKEAGMERVVLSGGCFQNRILLEQTVSRLRKNGFKVYWHQNIPTNDGGISVGQVAAAARRACSPKKVRVCV